MSVTTAVEYTIELCICCATSCAYGDTSGCEDSCGESHTATLLSFPHFCEEGEKIQGICIDAAEPWFSRHGCVGCGSDLGGDRFTGTVYVG